MSSNLAEKIAQQKMVAVAPEKKQTVLRKTTTINSVFVDSSLPNLTEYLIKSLKTPLINDAIKSLRRSLGEDWFSVLYTEDYSKHLDSEYSKIAVTCRDMAIGKREVDFSDLEGILTEEELQEYKDNHNTEYSFEEIKSYLVLSFGDVTDVAIQTLEQFKI